MILIAKTSNDSYFNAYIRFGVDPKFTDEPELVGFEAKLCIRCHKGNEAFGKAEAIAMSIAKTFDGYNPEVYGLETTH